MDKRRAPSTEYRFQDKTAPGLTSQSSSLHRRPAPKALHTRSGEARTQDADVQDPVKQDKLWREFVRTEWTGVKEWQKNWSFLKHYDQLGRFWKETPLPSSVPLFSNLVPNTTNQMFGNRVSTDLGQTLICLDNLKVLRGGCRKAKMDPEMKPC